MNARPALLPRLALLLIGLLPLALAAMPAANRAAAPVAGTDYEVITDGKPFAPAPGKIEVVEVFGYTCVHCAHFEPLVSAWKARLPADVQFTPVAAPFGGYWIPYAKAYYAAQSLGLVGKTHAAMFRALHDEGSLPISRPTAEEIAGFYARHGADAQQFIDAMSSPAVERQLEQAREFLLRSGVEGTPTLIVNGKYRVLGSPEDALRTADYLIARERRAQAAAGGG